MKREHEILFSSDDLENELLRDKDGDLAIVRDDYDNFARIHIANAAEATRLAIALIQATPGDRSAHLKNEEGDTVTLETGGQRGLLVVDRTGACESYHLSTEEMIALACALIRAAGKP